MVTLRSCLNDIAKAIRSKTGDSGSIKVKNMAAAIQNIPTGGTGVKVNTLLNARIELDDSILSLKGQLTGSVVDSGVKLENGVENANISIKGKRVDSFEYETIANTITSNTGDFESVTGDFEKYLISFLGNDSFTSSEMILTEPMIRLIVNSPEDTVNFTGQVGDDLKVFKNGELIPNDEGYVSTDIVPGTDTEFIYKGSINTWNFSIGDYDHVKKVILPNLTGISENVNLYRNGSLEQLIFTNPCSLTALGDNGMFSDVPNLKVAYLPSSVREIHNSFLSECNKLEYVNIPPVTNITGQILHRSYPPCLELTNGLNMMLDSNIIDLYYSNKEIHHIIVAGIPVGLEKSDLPDLKYHNSWLNQTGWEEDKYMSFPADTRLILQFSGGFANKLQQILIPVCVNTIETNAFDGISNPNEECLIRFESIVPPVFGENNSPSDVFPTSGSVTGYKVIVPLQGYEYYREVFNGLSYFTLIDDDTVEDDKGEFCIEILGDSLKTNPEAEPSIFGFIDGAGYYYLNEVLQKDETGELLHYDGGKIDITYPYWGRHSFTVASGFEKVFEGAFKGNKNIVKFRFPKALETIESKAFAGCSNLETLIFRDRLPDIADDAFLDLPETCKIYVPEYDKEIYEEFFKNNEIISYKTEKE